MVVKSLLDNESPFQSMRNKLLIYDDHPQKEAAMKQARERYEQYLKKQQSDKLNECRMFEEHGDLMKRIMDQRNL
jgi:hypothetical protein